MNTYRTLVLLVVVILVAACAGNQTKYAGTTQTPGAENASGYDEAYMARVERNAKRQGIIVQWINPPQAPKHKDGH